MAIDSEDKRRSTQAYMLGLTRPIADGTVGAPDRATAAWFYSGLTYGAPVGVGVSIRRFFTMIRKRLG